LEIGDRNIAESTEEVLTGTSEQTVADVDKTYASIRLDEGTEERYKAKSTGNTAVKFEALLQGQSARAHSLE
jgi:hypothetical protein